ncbi:MAG: 2-phosphosulfolactate phosphatase [Clostridia bacterium]|nr:2-phosphosulfolactate phosphatase [Clostridia bacterium]
MSGKTVVAIDVLRATSTIVTALANGAKEVIPVETTEKAFLKASKLSPESFLLGGEKYCQKIEGFHLGNSPKEYSPDMVRGKKIVFTSTNGAQTITASLNANKLVIGSLLNGKAVACELKNSNLDLVIACAGTREEFSLEDTFAAGMIIFHLLQFKSCHLNDLGYFSYKFFCDNKQDGPKLFYQSKAGRTLLELGLESDIRYCAQMNVSSVVPSWKGDAASLT